MVALLNDSIKKKDSFATKTEGKYISGLDGLRGIAVIGVIKDGVVHMEDADCPDKLCIKQGQIDSNGQKIVCLPNKTIVEVSSEKESDYDVKVK